MDRMNAPTDGAGQASPAPLQADELRRMDAWWRAANYLNVGQIYLQANPLLREPLSAAHIKPRLLGHWGTSPGLNLVYVHMNRLIRKYDLDAIYMAGPGHGGPALIANVWLEGSYTEFFPAVTQDEAGMLRLFRQFSTPGGVPSHVSVPTPGSIHEGGELGYVLVHAFGAVMDNPDLLVAAVVGDGESETGPLAGSWKSIDFINPSRDGAVLPILHLNGYKISGPDRVGTAQRDGLGEILPTARATSPCSSRATSPRACTRICRGAGDRDPRDPAASSGRARRAATPPRPIWPVIVLRTPKGWTGPKMVDGLPIEGTFRAHQVPVAEVKSNPDHLRILEDWMRSYQPGGVVRRARRASARTMPRSRPRAPAAWAPIRTPMAACCACRSRCRIFATMPSASSSAPASASAPPRCSADYLRDIYTDNPRNFRLFCPDETNSNRLGAVFDVSDRCLVSDDPAGRRPCLA